MGCVDWNKPKTHYEVLAFSRARVLETVSQILAESIGESQIEETLLEALEFCLRRPRLGSELREYLSVVLSEEDVEYLLGLIKEFRLLGFATIPGSSEELFFNRYQFGQRAGDIGKALAAFSREDREHLDVLVDKVSKTPGILLSDVNVPGEIKLMAVGLGVVEVSEVSSAAGTAKFLTAPSLAPPSVGQETLHLEEDVFHHAKMLLSSLRFGEVRSSYSRGRILDPVVLVNALLNYDRVGPCTAIGQDYMILESEGVIRTIPASDKPGEQRYMEIRRREPAEIVLGLLRSGASENLDAKALPRSLELPLEYSGPETSRLEAATQVENKNTETFTRMLQVLRT